MQNQYFTLHESKKNNLKKAKKVMGELFLSRQVFLFQVILYSPSDSRFKLDLADVFCSWANKKADIAKIRKVCADFITMVNCRQTSKYCFTEVIQLKRWTKINTLYASFIVNPKADSWYNGRLINVRLYIDGAQISIYHRTTLPRPNLSKKINKFHFPASLTKINRCPQN